MVKNCKGVQVLKLENFGDLQLPAYATEHSAGMDLLAAIDGELVISPMKRVGVPTGLSIAVPEGCEAQIRSRSGLAYNHGIFVLNSPGTIDADYRGEIRIILMNLGEADFTVSRGMRIAQMVFASYMHVSLDVVNVLSETHRGSGGFGSTGAI